MLSYGKKQANIQSYQNAEVNTSNRLKLLIMLYEGALRFGSQAETAMQNGDTATKGQMISKVLAIVDELQSTLDHGQAPEIAKNLERLYDFVHENLIRANIKNDVEKLRAALNVLKTLHSAWSEVSKMPMSELKANQPDQAKIMEKENKTAQGNSVRISV